MLTWQIGDVRITQIVELTTASLGPHLLPQATPEELEAIDWMRPFVDAQQRIVLSIHALVLEAHGQCLVVDTCIGNDKERTYPRWNHMQGRFLDDFEGEVGEGEAQPCAGGHEARQSPQVCRPTPCSLRCRPF